MFRVGAFKEPNAIREEGEVKSNDKTAIGDDTFIAESSADDGVAEKSSVIKDEGELRFRGQRFLPEVLAKDKSRQRDEAQHDDEAGEES